METEYKNAEKEKERFNDFRETTPQVVLEVYVLLKRGVVMVRHRTHYSQLSQLIAAAFPHAGEEAQKYVSIQASHPGREVMNKLGNNMMYSAFTDKEWNCDRFVIIPLSEESRIQELLFMPHVERTSASDVLEAEEIFRGLIKHNEYGAYDHRDNLRKFGLKPEQVVIDEINHSISINAEGDFGVGTKVSLGSFLKNLEIMGFKNVNLNLRDTRIILGEYQVFGKYFSADFSRPETWLPQFSSSMEIFIDVEGCRKFINSSSATTYSASA